MRGGGINVVAMMGWLDLQDDLLRIYDGTAMIWMIDV